MLIGKLIPFIFDFFRHFPHVHGSANLKIIAAILTDTYFKSMIQKRFLGIFALSCSLIALLSISCASRKHSVHTFFRMDTEVTITIADEIKNPTQLWNTIDSLLRDWEQRFSDYGPRSEVLMVNRRNSQRMEISQPLAVLIAHGLQFSDSTHGLFDMTVLPLKNIWGLGETDTVKQEPSAHTLHNIIAHVNYKQIQVDTSTNMLAFRDSLIRIDLGGVAKAFALREISTYLALQGFKNYLINGGGDIIGAGARSDHGAWRIGIQHPRKEGLLAALSLDSGVIFTSGDYERFWMNGTRRVHHIFNPSTGYSCTNNQSVTIWAMDLTLAKNYSTGLFCLPADSIVAFIQARNNLECIVVDSAGSIKTSKGIRPKIQWF